MNGTHQVIKNSVLTVRPLAAGYRDVMLLKDIKKFVFTPLNKERMKYDESTNWFAKILPVATYITASFAGIVLGSIIGIGEAIGGKTRIVLVSVGTAWFVLSCIPFVVGKRSLDFQLVKDTWWNTHFPLFIRIIVCFISFILGYKIFFELISMITAT